MCDLCVATGRGHSPHIKCVVLKNCNEFKISIGKWENYIKLVDFCCYILNLLELKMIAKNLFRIFVLKSDLKQQAKYSRNECMSIYW